MTFLGAVKKLWLFFHGPSDCQKSLGERERGARSARPVGETARSKPNEAGRAASELASDAERPCRIVEPKPFRGAIVPGGVHGGGGAIFAAENPIFQSKNRFFAVSAPGNPQDFSGNW